MIRNCNSYSSETWSSKEGVKRKNWDYANATIKLEWISLSEEDCLCKEEDVCQDERINPAHFIFSAKTHRQEILKGTPRRYLSVSPPAAEMLLRAL